MNDFETILAVAAFAWLISVALWAAWGVLARASARLRRRRRER